MPKILSDGKLPYPLPTPKYHQYAPYSSWGNVYTRKWDTGRGTEKWVLPGGGYSTLAWTGVCRPDLVTLTHV